MTRSCTVEDVLSWGPCDGWTEDRIREVAGGRERWTALDILALDSIPVVDRLWVVLRGEMIDPRTARLWACDCAERALERERAAGHEPDARSWAAISVSRRYAMGAATSDELAAARAAARPGVAAGVRDASRAATRTAARDAAKDAAWAAAKTAANAAARIAAWAAARAAVNAAASNAARIAERKRQVSRLREMLLAGGE